MLSLREATGLKQAPFARVRGVRGPTQIESEQVGAGLRMGTLAKVAATCGYALVWVDRDGATDAIDVTDVGQDTVRDAVAIRSETLGLVQRADYEACQRSIRRRFTREAKDRTAARLKKPRANTLEAVRANQRAAEAAPSLDALLRLGTMEAKFWAAKPKSAGAFAEMLDGAWTAVYEARLKPRLHLASVVVPPLAAVARELGVSRQLVHSHEERLLADLVWLGLAGALEGTAPAATLAEAAGA